MNLLAKATLEGETVLVLRLGKKVITKRVHTNFEQLCSNVAAGKEVPEINEFLKENTNDETISDCEQKGYPERAATAV